MYRAKADGRGVYRFFETEMGRQAEIDEASNSTCAPPSRTATFSSTTSQSSISRNEESPASKR